MWNVEVTEDVNFRSAALNTVNFIFRAEMSSLNSGASDLCIECVDVFR